MPTRPPELQVLAAAAAAPAPLIRLPSLSPTADYNEIAQTLRRGVGITLACCLRNSPGARPTPPDPGR
eukprot:15469809-Alexandrium_andersonii.AAC.1